MNEDVFFNLNQVFEGWFPKPMNLHFSAKTKDMMPALWENTDEGYKCTCRMVGIRPEDVSVKLQDEYIHVEGKSELDSYEYSQNLDLPVVEDVRNNLKNIKYKTQDGITIIYLNVNRPQKKEIKIEKMD